MPSSVGTRHDDTKVLLGAALCTTESIEAESVPGSIEAGLAVRRNTSTGAYQVAASGAGPILGVSMGPSLSQNGCFTLVYRAPKVAVQLGSGHEPAVGSAVSFDDSNGKTKAAGSGATNTSAIFEDFKTGISESGQSVSVAIINMASGL